MAYFDNASTTYPKPERVYTFMDEFYRGGGASAGRGQYPLAMSTEALIADTRKRIQWLLHCEQKQVVFTSTATIALNMIIQGIIRKGAKEIYVSPFEHNSVTRTLHYFEEQGLTKVHVLEVDVDLKYNLEKIRYQFDSVAPDFVVVSHASNVFGIVSPVEDIFTLAKRYNAVTLVDMAQTAGLIDLNVGNNVIDFAVFDGHKTLYGPTGIAGFIMNKQIELPPILFGGTGYDSANQNMPDSLPEKYEMGTFNTVGIAGLSASLQWIEETTIEALYDREVEHRKKLINILSDYSWLHIIGDNFGNHYVGIVSCVIDGISSDSASKVFDQLGIAVRTGLECAPLAHKFMKTFPAGTIRFSVSYFTDSADFEALRAALEKIDEEI